MSGPSRRAWWASGLTLVTGCASFPERPALGPPGVVPVSFTAPVPPSRGPAPLSVTMDGGVPAAALAAQGFPGPRTAAPSVALGIDDLAKRALGENPSVKSARARLQSAGANAPLALRGDLARAELVALADVRRAYWDLVATRAERKAIDADKARTQSVIAAAKARAEAGNASEQDLIRAELGLKELGLDLVQVERREERAQAALAEVLHYLPDAKVEVLSPSSSEETVAAPPELARLLELTEKNRPGAPLWPVRDLLAQAKNRRELVGKLQEEMLPGSRRAYAVALRDYVDGKLDHATVDSARRELAVREREVARLGGEANQSIASLELAVGGRLDVPRPTLVPGNDQAPAPPRLAERPREATRDLVPPDLAAPTPSPSSAPSGPPPLVRPSPPALPQGPGPKEAEPEEEEAVPAPIDDDGEAMLRDLAPPDLEVRPTSGVAHEEEREAPRVFLGAPEAGD